MATAEKNGLMPMTRASKSYISNIGTSNRIVHICRLNQYDMITIFLQWGVFVSSTLNVAFIYLNNRSQNGNSSLERSISRINGNEKLYIKYSGDIVDIYAVLSNNYVRVDCTPISSSGIKIVIKEVLDIQEAELVPIF